MQVEGALGRSNRIGNSDAVRHHEGCESQRQRGPVRARPLTHLSIDCKRNGFCHRRDGRVAGLQQPLLRLDFFQPIVI